MSEQRTVCEKCGSEYGIGDSPFCRDGHTGGGSYGYEALTPYEDDMIGTDPVHFGNRGERIRYMDKHGIAYRDLSHHKRSGKLYFT